jgi:hypothetical protein
MISEKEQQIATLVLLAKNAQRFMRAEKKSRWRSESIIAHSRGNRNGLFLAARLLKGFTSQARTRNASRRVAA